MQVDGRRLECVAPAFDGAASVTGAVWMQVGSHEEPIPLPKATGLTFDAPAAGRYTCSIRARSEGDAARTRGVVPVAV